VKLIVCPHCKAKAIGPPTEDHPQGGPVLMGRWIGSSDHPVVFKCHRCTNAIRLRAIDFNGLPEIACAFD